MALKSVEGAESSSRLPGGKTRVHYRGRFAILIVLLVVIAFGSFCVGRYFIAPQDVLSTLLSLFGIGTDSGQVDPSAYSAVVNVRLPRIIAALFVGMGLSLAGAAYQGLFQNPMASQDVLGASSGASFGAALGIFLGASGLFVSVYAFFFGLAAVAISYIISRASRMGSIISMILAGMVVSALCSSGTSFIKLVADTEEQLPAITYWLMGSFSSIRLGDLWFLILLVLSGLPIVLLRWRINLLATGEEEARSMGMNVTLMRGIIVICATFLTATCVSMSGLIGWVGLVIPHFCRIMFGQDYRRVIPASLLMGSAFLLLVDDIARVITTSEIPIGILTAFVGAPVFVFLILRSGRRHET